jgi:hypothetical protein
MMRKIQLTVSGRLCMAALAGMAIVHLLSTLLLNGELSSFALVFELLLLALVALVATGWRWAPAVAAGLCGTLFLSTLGGWRSGLTRPPGPEFLSAVLFLVLALAAIIGGNWARVLNYRSGRPQVQC